jgi:hypothetical protein
VLPKSEKKKPPTDEEIKRARLNPPTETKILEKSKPKKIKYSGAYVRREKVHAQIITLPRHAAQGILEAQISSINVDSANKTDCRARFYAGNLIVEIQSSNASMSFITNSIQDAEAFEHGIHAAIRKMRKTLK